MDRKRTKKDLSEKECGALTSAVRRPTILLAEAVGRFESPFEYLKGVIGGFSEMKRFVLNKVLTGDPAALLARNWQIAAERAYWLNEPYPQTLDLWTEYLLAHETEFRLFRENYYPWVFTDASPLELFEPHPETDALLDHYICKGLEDYGFTVKMRKFKKSYWRCYSTQLPRRVAIEFDKGTMHPAIHMNGGLEVDDLGYSTSIGYPFFYSGDSFYTSKVHDVHTQFERFFSEYIRLFPHIWTALAEGIAAGEDVLATLSKKSVS